MSIPSLPREQEQPSVPRPRDPQLPDALPLGRWWHQTPQHRSHYVSVDRLFEPRSRIVDEKRVSFWLRSLASALDSLLASIAAFYKTRTCTTAAQGEQVIAASVAVLRDPAEAPYHDGIVAGDLVLAINHEFE